MENFVITPIHNDDSQKIIDLILPIQQIEFNVPITLESQSDLYDVDTYYHNTGGGFWGAKVADELIGTIALTARGEKSGTIRKMFVKKEFRGKETGVAQCLLETLVVFCEAQGITKLYLGTVDMLKAAHRFYERNGFVLKKSEEMPSCFLRGMGENVFYERQLETGKTITMAGK